MIPLYNDCEISTDDADGSKVAISLDGTMRVIPENGESAQVFMRNAKKGVGSPKPEHVRWLVGELDGVRVYQHGNNVIVTKKDLYP